MSITAAGTAAGLEAVIGLEVHCRLLTESKAFCACPNRYGDAPNENTCPTCLGLPGALPVFNERALDLALRVVLATGGRLRRRSVFARKSYFYPDLPKGYQVTQHEQPLAEGGAVDIEAGGRSARPVRLARLHLEEDAGRSLHDRVPDRTLVDFNRAGAPLVEIVTEPELSSPEEAQAFVAAVRQLVRWLRVCDANMEEGSLRCDCNVSLRRPGGSPGTRVEIKNLNSVRAVGRALESEIARQAAVLRAGRRVEQGTRSWDEQGAATRAMRDKEAARDYRYFPDPDLLPLEVSAERLAAVRRELPESAAARRLRWVGSHGLSEADASVLTASRSVGEYFEGLAAACGDAREAAKWVLGEVLRHLNAKGVDPDDPEAAFPLPEQRLAQLIGRVADGTLSLSAAKAVFERLAWSDRGVDEVVDELGLRQLTDEASLRRLVAEVVESETAAVADHRAGRERALGHLMGRVMAASGGRADPRRARSLLLEALATDPPADAP